MQNNSSEQTVPLNQYCNSYGGELKTDAEMLAITLPKTYSGTTGIELITQNASFVHLIDGKFRISPNNTNQFCNDFTIVDYHMKSDNSRATGYNNGRRIVKDNGGNLHLTYEDNGSVWYTYSSNQGQNWTPEMRAGDGLSNPHPSIAITNGQPGEGITPHIVWETALPAPNGGTVNVITYTKKTANGFTEQAYISNGEWVWTGHWSGDNCSRPVIIGESSDFLQVAWLNQTTNKIQIRQHINGSWGAIVTINGNGYPLMARSSIGDRKTKILWAESGHIKYMAGDFINGSWNCSSIYNLTSGFPSYLNHHNYPSMSIDQNNMGHVVWEGDDQAMLEKNIFYQKYTFNDYYASPYGSLTSLAMGELGGPLGNSVVSYHRDSNTITVFYDYSEMIYRRKKIGSAAWTSAYSFNSGKYPNIADNSLNGAVWTKYTSAPYIVATDYSGGGLNKTGSGETNEFKRFIYPIAAASPDTNYLYSDLESFKVNGQSYIINDSLRSAPLTLVNGDQLTLSLRLRSDKIEEDLTLLNIWLVNEKSRFLLDKVKFEGNDGENIHTQSLTFDSQQPLCGFIELTYDEVVPFMMNVAAGGSEGSSLAKAANESSSITELSPKEFSLSQNFPNPFNPITQISYALPQAGDVTLKIYDVNGREIAVLAEGYKEAGRYQAVFNGANLSSGVYFYRLEAGSFSAVKRMLLIR